MDDVRNTVSRETIASLYQHALEFIDVARALIRQSIRDGFTVQNKPDGSFVTDADTNVERRLRAEIEQAFPTHGILGEEFAPRLPQAEFQWILDPIDGTEDFVHRVPTFGSILAVHYRGLPLIGVVDHPALDRRVAAAYGLGTHANGERVRLDDTVPADDQARLVLSARANFIRYRDAGADFDRLTRWYPNHRIYRSCFGHTLTAIGAVDAMVDYHDRLWDIAAIPILVTEAGGAYHELPAFEADGGQIFSNVSGRPRLVKNLVARLTAAKSESPPSR